MRKLSLGAKILILAIIGVFLSSGVSSWLALNRFEKLFTPALENKTSAVGLSVTALITKFLDYGIPFDRLRGLDEEFSQLVQAHPEISSIAVRNVAGETLYANKPVASSAKGILRVETTKGRETVLSLVTASKAVGTLHVWENSSYAANQWQKILYDILTVIVISVLLAVELLLFLTTFSITAPIQSLHTLMNRVRGGDLTAYRPLGKGDEIDRVSGQVNGVLDSLNCAYHELRTKCGAVCGPVIESGQRCATDCVARLKAEFRFRESVPSRVGEQRLIFVRPPLFLLIFSESMSLSFFPIYVESLYKPFAGIPKDFLIGLPISLFMLVWACSLPPAGQWSEHQGRRKSFIIGAGVTALGLVLTGLVTNMLGLLICRCLTAVGYGLVFITAQGYVTDNTTAETRTKGMAIFISGFFSGAMCGAAIGGILANQIGYQQTFLLSAALSVASALFVYQFIKEDSAEEKPPVRKLRLADMKYLLGNPRFLRITFLSAIPAKVCLTGFLYYTGPLYLKFLGNDSSAAGRILMVYGLAIILFSPLSASLVDRFNCRQSFVTLGGLLSGLSVLILYFYSSVLGVLAAVCLLGLGHAIGVSPQISLITALPQSPDKEVALGTTIGIFRLVERLGNIGGPMIAAALITLFNFNGLFLVFGVYMLGTTLLFYLSGVYFDRLDLKRSRVLSQEGCV